MKSVILATAAFGAGFSVRNLLGVYYGRGAMMAVQMALIAVVLGALIVGMVV